MWFLSSKAKYTIDIQQIHAANRNNKIKSFFLYTVQSIILLNSINYRPVKKHFVAKSMCY